MYSFLQTTGESRIGWCSVAFTRLYQLVGHGGGVEGLIASGNMIFVIYTVCNHKGWDCNVSLQSVGLNRGRSGCQW